jgi:hypothetical protein
MATSTIRLPERWREAVMKGENSFTDFTPVSDDDAAREHLLMNLRLSEGVDLAAYQARWGARPSSAKIGPLIEQGLLRHDGETIRATPPRPAGAECCDRGNLELEASCLESFRRRAHHMEAIRLDFQHRQASFGGAVGVETEDAIDAGKAVGVHQRGLGEAVIGLAL